MELYVYDLVMFENKKTTSISLETIQNIRNYNTERFGKFHINKTNTYNFTDKLEVLNETYQILPPILIRETEVIIPSIIVNEDIEIVGIWRFNPITKNYDKVYYEGEKNEI